MINVAIVEDEDIDVEKLLNCLKQYDETHNCNFSYECFKNPVSFLDSYSFKYDLIFMDIDMPLINGMAASEKIREIDSNVTLVFITKMIQFAVQGYQYDPVDFIVKPLVYDEFALKMKKILSKIKPLNSNSVIIKNKESSFCLECNKIFYLETDGHYVNFHTEDGVYRQYTTLKKLLPYFNANQFVFCNRCFLVNLKYVSSIEKNIVHVGTSKLIISRPQKKAFYLKLSNFAKGVSESDT